MPGIDWFTGSKLQHGIAIGLPQEMASSSTVEPLTVNQVAVGSNPTLPATPYWIPEALDWPDPVCRCHECQGIYCNFWHPGHSCRDLTGIPAIMGTDEDFPITHRFEYLGIPREGLRASWHLSLTGQPTTPNNPPSNDISDSGRIP